MAVGPLGVDSLSCAVLVLLAGCVVCVVVVVVAVAVVVAVLC